MSDHADMTAGGCVQCGTVNLPRARFCMRCGSLLGRSCLACGTAAPAGALFCIACGGALERAPGVPEQAPRARAEERRTVTVMFADIVGYTTISERLDYESVKRLTVGCMSRLATEVERLGGYVDQYIGDNLMAVFGAPLAHENDAERAVRTAAAMHEAMAELNDSLGAEFGVELTLRVGINTGEVLAGTVGGEYTVVGDAVNIASRLQGAAERGRTLVGERTRRSTAAIVSYRPVGSLTLKGKQQPVSAWEVTAIEDPGAPVEHARRAPLIARRRELQHLGLVYDQVARDGIAQIVTVIGEAGVGKTRLLHEFEQRLDGHPTPPHFLRGRALGFGAESAFGPVAQMLREHAAADAGVDGNGARDLCERLLASLEPAGAVEPELDGEDARERFFAMVRAFIQALGSGQVPVLVWEDAQWADEGTLELIDHLADSLQTPVLQICIGREDLLARRPRWATNRLRRACILLEPLKQDEARDLIDALLSGATPETERELLAQRTGGNPLFAEALVDALGDGDGDRHGPGLPETIQGLLATRLDALEPFERQLLGHASVVGLRFPLSALESLSAGGDLYAALATLHERNLIVPSTAAAHEREFAFGHMLIREAAYEMLPKSIRARKHVEVAEALSRSAGSGGEAPTFALAEHHARAATLAAEVHLPPAELASMRRAALEHGIAAGDAAAALFSNQEALDRYRAATPFAEPEDPLLDEIAERSGEVEARLGRMDAAIDAWERCLRHHRARQDAERAAEMHRKIAAALLHKGERDPAVKHLQRGINLVRDEPASPALARLFAEAAALYMQLGANMLAAYAAERSLAIAEQLDDPRAASRAHMIYGGVFGRIGDSAKARRSLDRAVELVRDVDPPETVLALLAAGRYLYHLEGDEAAARARFAEALALARHTGDVPQQVELYAALGAIALRRAEWTEAAAAADQVSDLAETHGLAGKLCLADVLRGRLQWRCGELEDSASLLSAASKEGALASAELSAEALLALGATLRDAGALDAAAAALGEAAAVSERSGLRPQATEAYARLALVAVRAGRPDDGADAARRAAHIAANGPGRIAAAAALEAQGVTADETDGIVGALEQARQRWEELGRPLDAARCTAEIAERLGARDPGRARAIAQEAAARFQALEVGHLADQWQRFARGSAPLAS